MPRDVTSDMIAALSANLIRPALFVSCAFKNEVVYAWSGIGSITWNSHTWLGVGSLGSISSIEETVAVEAKGVTIALSGCNPGLLSDVLGDYQVGLPVMVYIGVFDPSGTLVTSPILSFAGRMDKPTVTISGSSATIQINCENRLVDMNSSVERRYTDVDQQQLYPGDLGFSFVNSIQQVTIYWGTLPSSGGSSTIQGHS